MADEESREKDPKREEFLAKARKQFEADVADEQAIREQALLDLRFVAGDQWASDIKSERTAKGRLALTFPRCHTFVQQVSNEARQNKPQIKFVAGDGGNQDTAEIKEGIARHIQYSSDAQVAYETAVEYSAGGSFGYFGFITDWCDDKGWDQELKVRAFLDPFSVYGVLIPSCFGMEPQHAFVIEEVPLDEYKRQYDTDAIEEVGWDQATKLSDGWIGTDTVRVAEYWYIEYSANELKRKNPKTGKDETRKVSVPQVKFCKMNGFEVIEGTETDWDGYCIPIVPVLGKQIILDGKPTLFSVVRFQRDSQQLINYYKTRIAETIASSPIQPWIMAEGQIQGHEREWAEMNSTLRTHLTYKPIDVNGKEVPPPQRMTFESPIQALSLAAGQEIDDMKATTGIFDASLGNRSNEQSGLAIQRRMQQSNVTNMHFMDNLERAFKKGGLIIADLMPKIYDTERMIRILGPDEAPKIIKINGQHQDEAGKTYHYKIGGDDSGKYDVIVTMGRAFSTKREESFDMMTSVLQAQPDLMGVIGDIFFQNSDTAGNDLMAERIKRFIQITHPGLIEDKSQDPAAMAQQLQAQLQQAHQVIQLGQQHIQQLEQEKQAKVVEHQGKVQIAQAQEQSKQTIAQMQEATKIAIAEITTKAQNAVERAQMYQEIWKEIHGSAHDAALQASDQAHEANMAQMGHEQALEQGAQAQQINGQELVSASS